MLPIMATAKTKFVVIRQKLDFLERQEKTFPHKVLSRVPQLQVSTAGDDHAVVFLLYRARFLSMRMCPEVM